MLSAELMSEHSPLGWPAGSFKVEVLAHCRLSTECLPTMLFPSRL